MKKNASVESATKSGKAESLATVQAEMAVKGLSVLSYVQSNICIEAIYRGLVLSTKHGLVVTDESVYPYFYLVKMESKLVVGYTSAS